MTNKAKKWFIKDMDKDVTIEATQWFKNGDHPDDDCEMIYPDATSTTQFEPFLSEGKVVRHFRHTLFPSTDKCHDCGKTMDIHGWIDSPGGGCVICPGDFIATNKATGEYYPLKQHLKISTNKGGNYDYNNI